MAVSPTATRATTSVATPRSSAIHRRSSRSSNGAPARRCRSRR
jgi:hypothetical protein